MNESKSQPIMIAPPNFAVVVNLSISMNESKSQLLPRCFNPRLSCSKSQYFNE